MVGMWATSIGSFGLASIASRIFAVMGQHGVTGLRRYSTQRPASLDSRI